MLPLSKNMFLQRTRRFNITMVPGGRRTNKFRFKLILFLFSFLFQAPIQAATKDKLYDVVIISGGLSGLSAAHELKGYDSVILENNNHMLKAYEQNGPPLSLQKQERIAISYKGKIFYCDNVIGCITQLGVDQHELNFFLRYNQCPTFLLASSEFSKKPYKILNSLFRTIDPGGTNDYISAKLKDPFVRWPIENYSGRNRLIVDAFKKSLSSKIELNAEVTSIEDYGKYVVTFYRQEGRIKKMLSKAVIVGTPSRVTKRILGRINPECLSFLNSVRHIKFTVVVIGFKDVHLGKFSYLLTPDFRSNFIIFKTLKNKKTSVLFIYYGDKESRQQTSDSDSTLIDRSINIVHKLNMGNFTNHNILFTDIKRQDYEYTIIPNSRLKDNFDKSHFLSPSKRVFLAGDYVYKHDPYPYGMLLAIRSGKTAAEGVVNLLKATQDSHQSCYKVDGITMLTMPDQKSIGYLSKIQPAIFGLTNSLNGLKYLEGLDQRKVFGYDFLKFYGSDNFSNLLQAQPLIHDTAIIGYCPKDTNLSEAEFSQHIESLKKIFPNKKILIGPCVDLFDKVNQSKNYPDILGFEIFEKNFDEYLNGKYDNLIEKTLGNRMSVYIFITLFGYKTDLEKLEKVIKKAISQRLQIGYCFNSNERLFDFILKHLCI